MRPRRWITPRPRHRTPDKGVSNDPREGQGGGIISGYICRGVAQYFFFRSILMKSHFDTDAAEVWAKYTSEKQLSCKHSTEVPIWSLLAPKSLDLILKTKPDTIKWLTGIKRGEDMISYPKLIFLNLKFLWTQGVLVLNNDLQEGRSGLR